MESRLLTPENVADELGVPRATLYQWRFHGRGPRAIKVGRHLRFRRADVDQWLEEQADPMTKRRRDG